MGGTMKLSSSFILSFVATAVSVLIVLANAQLPPDANSPAAFLAPHNAARKLVGVPALTWNTTLANYSRDYANSRKDKCLPLVHSRGPYGENLFWGKWRVYTPNDAVDYYWVSSERSDYKYSTNSCTPGKMCGHYTQVVWRNTKQVGCASILCSDGAIYIICSYSPRGNVIGQLPY